MVRGKAALNITCWTDVRRVAFLGGQSTRLVQMRAYDGTGGVNRYYYVTKLNTRKPKTRTRKPYGTYVFFFYFFFFTAFEFETSMIFYSKAAFELKLSSYGFRVTRKRFRVSAFECFLSSAFVYRYILSFYSTSLFLKRENALHLRKLGLEVCLACVEDGVAGAVAWVMARKLQ